MGVSLEESISNQSTEELIPARGIADTLSKFTQSTWYKYIIYYLQNLQCPDQMERLLKLKVIKYCILDDPLYWKDTGGILLTCITKEQMGEIIDEIHRGICGGHQA